MDYEGILRAYTKGETPFEERNEYVGMEASTIPELFVKFFARQNSHDQQGLAAALVTGMLEDGAVTPEESAGLTTWLCGAGHASLFRGYRAEIEEQARQYLSAWLERDNQDRSNGNERMTWHYGLKLHAILSALDSPVAACIRAEAESKSRSSWFREGLLSQLENKPRRAQS